MANCFVRIYEGEPDETDIIGASPRVKDVVYARSHRFGHTLSGAFLLSLGHESSVIVGKDSPNLIEIVKTHDATVTELPNDDPNLPLLSCSNAYMEVGPSMSDITVRRLGVFLARSGLVQGIENKGFLVDTRPGHDNEPLELVPGMIGDL